jgi:hypothetical protein
MRIMRTGLLVLAISLLMATATASHESDDSIDLPDGVSEDDVEWSDMSCGGGDCADNEMRQKLLCTDNLDCPTFDLGTNRCTKSRNCGWDPNPDRENVTGEISNISVMATNTTCSSVDTPSPGIIGTSQTNGTLTITAALSASTPCERLAHSVREDSDGTTHINVTTRPSTRICVQCQAISQYEITISGTGEHRIILYHHGHQVDTLEGAFPSDSDGSDASNSPFSGFLDTLREFFNNLL